MKPVALPKLTLPARWERPVAVGLIVVAVIMLAYAVAINSRIGTEWDVEDEKKYIDFMERTLECSTMICYKNIMDNIYGPVERAYLITRQELVRDQSVYKNPEYWIYRLN